MNCKSLSFFFLIILFATACTVKDTPQPSSTTAPYLVATSAIAFKTTTPTLTPTLTPESTLALTITPELTSLPNCNIFDEDGKLYVLSTDIFFSWGPKDEEITQALAADFPEWANFEQTLPDMSHPLKIGEVMVAASLGQETFALNPTVTLVTMGVSLDWQLPPDGDLYSRAIATGKRLEHLWHEWTHPDNENIRVRYPNLANDGATYALYAFFDYDREKLQVWAAEYDVLFGHLQPRIPSVGVMCPPCRPRCK
ncbi:hypothetical protein D6779_09010 [Candidatus Parcubacteria bacterium]|nr:MAG: hypothetical protein D6779_09010 [Candidatus Parcubacteria bacterium]